MMLCKLVHYYWCFMLLWKWRQYTLPKCWQPPTRLCGVITQKTTINIFIDITSNSEPHNTATLLSNQLMTQITVQVDIYHESTSRIQNTYSSFINFTGTNKQTKNVKILQAMIPGKITLQRIFYIKNKLLD